MNMRAEVEKRAFFEELEKCSVRHKDYNDSTLAKDIGYGALHGAIIGPAITAMFRHTKELPVFSKGTAKAGLKSMLVSIPAGAAIEGIEGALHRRKRPIE